MERGFVLVLTAVAYLVGLPILALSGGDGGAGLIAYVLIGLGSIGLLLFVIATGMVIGLREVRDEREHDPRR